MHFKISSAICFNLGHSKILSSGNGLKPPMTLISLKAPRTCNKCWCPCHDRYGACFLPGLFVYKKNFKIGRTFWMVSDTGFIFHICCLWDKGRFFDIKVKVICQGQTSRSWFSKMAWDGWERGHLCFTNISCLSLLCACSTSLLKTLWEKGVLPITSNFSFSHNVFYLFEELSGIFIKFEIVVCKLFQFGSLKFVVW